MGPVETCPETGKLHRHGYVETKFRVRPTEKFRNAVPKSTHWEKRKGSREEAIEYCIKEGEADILHGWEPPEVIEDYLENKELHAWQHQVLQILAEKPHDRITIWVWSKGGGVGKSTFVRHLLLKHNAFLLGNVPKDAYFAVAKLVENKTKFSTLIMDIPYGKRDDIDYTIFEKIKDGQIFSGKYESGQVVFNRKHMLVFANFPPDTLKMTENRFSVIKID